MTSMVFVPINESIHFYIHNFIIYKLQHLFSLNSNLDEDQGIRHSESCESVVNQLKMQLQDKEEKIKKLQESLNDKDYEVLKIQQKKSKIDKLTN